ncbi:uncharacterized protein A1O9_12792 [Exophiala aquamarina CBS 119918]|uniref:Arginyl-tRNA synthetase catalytic core domain-containing protein n=1 Tax=Exophiala aquamarina CBS 119918 TaxID=1182545 RepID=A0A072NVX3_9EURO|nr:uncharacterized protein A1O9_12792 [Exophiala aquamarina CBS 119918]KEF51178.1 hypothetical protein A1O9_12792 [Exophiala aquamarina CBS 119918]
MHCGQQRFRTRNQASIHSRVGPGDTVLPSTRDLANTHPRHSIPLQEIGGEEEKLMPDAERRPILGSPKLRYENGTSTYLLRDIAAVLERSRQYSFDKMIYVVTGKQDLHFHQVSRALELMGRSELASKLEHINFGKVHGLAPATGCSGLLLEDILDQCQKAVCMFLEMERDDLYGIRGSDASAAADSLAVLALMTQEMSIKRGANFGVDLDDMATLNPYNGLSLQYWLSKINMKLKGVIIPREALGYVDYSMFGQDEYEAFADVLRLLIQFPGTVKPSFRTLESSHILILLFRVTDLLPDVWEADPDNNGAELEEEVEVQPGPSNIVTAEPLDDAELTTEGVEKTFT